MAKLMLSAAAPNETSDALNVSSGDGVVGLGGWREGSVLVVGLAGGQAVVEAADEAVEQVSLGGGVPVAGGAAAVVVGSGTGGGGEGGERPVVPGGGEPLVLDAAVLDGPGLAAGFGDGGGAGVGLEAFSIGEAGPVVADLAEHPGAGERAESWEAGDEAGVRVLVKRLHRSLLEVGRGGAGGVELAEQGQGLASHRLLDQGELT